MCQITRNTRRIAARRGTRSRQEAQLRRLAWSAVRDRLHLHTNFVRSGLPIRQFGPLERGLQFLQYHRLHVKLHTAGVARYGVSCGLVDNHALNVLCSREAKQFRVLRTSCDAARYQFGWRTRARSKSRFARPYIWRLRNFSRLICPSTCPLLQGDSKAARTADRSAVRRTEKRRTSAALLSLARTNHRSKPSTSRR